MKYKMCYFLLWHMEQKLGQEQRNIRIMMKFLCIIKKLERIVKILKLGH
jgi:hypothetical protein